MNFAWKYGCLSFWEDYSPVFKCGKGYNWVNFCFIHFEVEYDKAGPQFEIEIGLVGINFRISLWLPHSTELSEELKRRVAEIRTHKCCGHVCSTECEASNERV